MRRVAAALAGTMLLATATATAATADGGEEVARAPSAAAAEPVASERVVRERPDRSARADRDRADTDVVRAEAAPLSDAVVQAREREETRLARAVERVGRAHTELQERRKRRQERQRERREAEEARQQQLAAAEAGAEASSPEPAASNGSGSLTGVAARIARCESGGDPTAQNPVSSASGLFQFIDSTWESVTGKPAPASDYSVGEQIAAFETLWAGGAGAGHWAPSRHCWG